MKPGTRVDRFPVFVSDIEVGEHEAKPKVGTPGHGVPVIDDAESIVAEPLPGCFDFANDDDAEEDEPGVLQLDRNSPEDTGSVVTCYVWRGVGDEVEKLQCLVDEPAEVGVDCCLGPCGPGDRRDVLEILDRSQIHEEVLKYYDCRDGNHQSRNTTDDLLGYGTEVACAKVTGAEEASRCCEEQADPDVVEEERLDGSTSPELACVMGVQVLHHYARGVRQNPVFE